MSGNAGFFWVVVVSYIESCNCLTKSCIPIINMCFFCLKDLWRVKD